jgi:FG-GAP-like repeat/Cep192 domain 4
MRTVYWVSFCLCVMWAGTLALAQSNPVPFINQPLVPMTTAPGGSGFTLTVNGTGFVSSSVVNWNGTALATTFVASSQLTATAPASDIATPGTATVTVTNPTPGGGTSNVEFFDVSGFANSVTFTQLPPAPGLDDVSGIITADFNGDGKLDLAYLVEAIAPGSVIIQLGNGDGSFQAPVSYPAGDVPSALVASDFNGDGKLDVAAANTQGNTISILLGNGDGTFKSQITVPTAPGPLVLVAGDFNGDGKLDLAAANRYQDSGDVGGVSILLGNGDGTFQSHVDYATSLFAYATTIGDFNGDGNLDLIFFLGGSLPGQLLFLPGNGDGTFQSPQSFPADSNVESLIAADFNEDGNLDLVTADLGGGAYVFLGNGNGTFQSAVEYAPGHLGLCLAAGDFNADGKLDLALTNQDQDSFSVLLGNGDGTFQSPVDFPTSEGALGVAAGDFNGDGKLDLAVVVNAPVVFLQGQFPVSSLSPPNLTFGQQAIGTTSPPEEVTLTNSGVVSLTISNIQITGANAGDFAQKNDCPPTLGANANCLINVTFTPSIAGIRTAAVSISDNAPGNPQSVPLTGTTPVYTSPTAVTFPNQYVGTSGLPQSVQLNNTGNAALTISSVTASPADFAPLSACGSSLAPGASCSIGVFFDPTTSGTRNGTLTVTDSASDSPQMASLTGVGQDFSMSASSSSSAAVSPGQIATYMLSVVPDGGFNQTVLLSCSGEPKGSSCSASPSSAVLNGSTPIPVTVTVTTAGASASLSQPSGLPGSWSRLAIGLSLCVLPGLVMLKSIGARSRNRHRLIRVLAFACLFSLAITWSACGGGAGSGGGTQPATYNLVVTGTFSSGSTVLKHTVPLTLIVH